MASGINKVILVGNLGREVQVQTFENGIKKASFSMATDESYKDRSGQKIERTEWHNVVMWRGLAEIAERYLRKGSKVYIEGRIRTRQYTDQQNVTKYFTEIEALNMVMLDSRESQGAYPNQNAGYQSQQAPSQAQTPYNQQPYQQGMPPSQQSTAQNQPTQQSQQQPPASPQQDSEGQNTPFQLPQQTNQEGPGMPDLQSGEGDDDLPF